LFFKSRDGGVFQNDTSFCPLPQHVEWAPLFDVDASGLKRVAPIFSNAAAAVSWLRQAVEEKRKLPWYSRKREPDFASELPTGPLGVGELGLGLMNNYRKLIHEDGFLISTFLYRGQENVQYPFVPTLARPLWQPIGLGKGSFDGAQKALSAEEQCTNHFTTKFFADTTIQGRFDWLNRMSVPRRAAIARHHGFYSWTIDFTLDPGIAAWFATGGAAKKAPTKGFGIIQVIDEHELTQVFGKESWIINHPGYQERSWSGVNEVNMEIVLKNTSVVRSSKRVGALIDGDWWSQIKSRRRALKKLCCDLYFTPGMEVERMWQQKWCGLEATCSNMGLAEIITAYQVLSRIVDCVMFRHTGSVYEDANAQISYEHLLPSRDAFSLAVEEYKQAHQLNPGSFAGAFMRALAPETDRIVDEAGKELLAQAQESHRKAKEFARTFDALDMAIELFRDVAAKYETLQLPMRQSIALIDLGANLVNRAWTPPNLVDREDAAQAEKVLSKALDLLTSVTDPLKPSLRANALAWRARARTFLAETDRKVSDLAIQDGQEAVGILQNQTGDSAIAHDLAIAHLHLARAYFFRVSSTKSLFATLGGQRYGDTQQVRNHAAEASRLDPTDRHIQVEASWLLQHVGNL
jgi:tetratricopeptide (TPR) repeat protein